MKVRHHAWAVSGGILDDCLERRMSSVDGPLNGLNENLVDEENFSRLFVELDEMAGSKENELTKSNHLIQSFSDDKLRLGQKTLSK